MKTKAAVAFEPNKPLEIVELDLAAPRKGEVLVEIVASGVCHPMPIHWTGEILEGTFLSS